MIAERIRKSKGVTNELEKAEDNVLELIGNTIGQVNTSRVCFVCVTTHYDTY